VNGAEHGVKLHGKCDEAHIDLIQHHSITACPPLQPAQSSITFIEPGSPHAAALRRYLSSIEPIFFPVNGALHAVKLDGKCDEAHTDLTRHRGKSPVTTRAELDHVYYTWESSHRCTSQTTAVGRGQCDAQSRLHSPLGYCLVFFSMCTRVLKA
jgi:hypothetical protein